MVWIDARDHTRPLFSDVERYQGQMHQSCTTHRQQNIAPALALCRSLCSIHTVVEIIMTNYKCKEENKQIDVYNLTYCIRRVTGCLYSINSIKSVFREWHLHEVSLQIHHVARYKVFFLSTQDFTTYVVSTRNLN